ncbi:MAG: hypothetical protein HC865_11960 [Cyanobacteria bacterium RU_5_0]|nr:hypothetical protein [Cyanobacteria bacterium RU_5_0]
MQNWAIVVGINHYEHLSKDKHLKCAVQDAEAVKAFLCKSAGFPSNNILLCSDRSPSLGNISTRPSRTNLRRILQEEILQAGGADNFWFFFAGHGISKNYQDYLLPCDGYPFDEESAISVRFVVDCLRRCRAQNIVLVLDMCREGKPQSTGSRGVTEIGQETIEITQQQGIITIFSCSIGAESYEIAELRQGAFTYVLLNGLKQHLVLRQLEQYLIRGVPALNRQYKKPAQVPLIIPEPGWKYDLPLLAELVAKEDGSNQENDKPNLQQAEVFHEQSRGELQIPSQHEEEQQQVIQLLEQQIQVLQSIIDDAKTTSNIAGVRERFLRWRRKATDLLSEAVGKQESLNLVMMSARGDFRTDKARLLNEATQIRNYLIALSQKLSSKEN